MQRTRARQLALCVEMLESFGEGKQPALPPDHNMHDDACYQAANENSLTMIIEMNNQVKKIFGKLKIFKKLRKFL